MQPRTHRVESAFHDVGAAADPAVQVDLRPPVHGIHDSGEHVDRRGQSIELPAAVVGDPYGIHPAGDGLGGIPLVGDAR